MITAIPTFDRTTALVPTGEGTFTASLDPSWSSLVGVHGGYMAAHVVRAVELVDSGRQVRTLTASFLRRGVPGDAHVSVHTVRAGRSISVHEVTLDQSGGTVLRARVTTTGAVAEPLVWATDPVELPPPLERCEPLAPPDHVRHFDQAVAWLDPAGRPFSGGDRARLAGWVQPLEARPVDAAWLTMILDWFPPSAFVRTQPPTGGVSIDYSVHLHRVPVLRAGEWLAGVFRTDTAFDGLGLEHGVLATADGVPVAESFHTRLT